MLENIKINADQFSENNLLSKYRNCITPKFTNNPTKHFLSIHPRFRYDVFTPKKAWTVSTPARRNQNPEAHPTALPILRDSIYPIKKLHCKAQISSNRSNRENVEF